MNRVTRWAPVLIGCAALATLAAPAQAQTKDKVYRNVTPAQLEGILNGLNIKFTKTQPKNLPNDWDYDFDRNTFKIRFTLANGKLLWLSAFFPKASLEKINAWNVQAKFSRGVLDRIQDREYAIVEAQIDASGGCTDEMIRQFIRRFDDEVSRFDQFIK